MASEYLPEGQIDPRTTGSGNLAHGRQERVQAATGPPGVEDHPQGLWKGSTAADHEQVQLMMRLAPQGKSRKGQGERAKGVRNQGSGVRPRLIDPHENKAYF